MIHSQLFFRFDILAISTLCR